MVFDSLEHFECYKSLGDRIATALKFLRDPETASLEPPGFGTDHSLRHEIDGDNVFALVQRYRTKSPTDAFWEAHRLHIDVQCVIEGAEMMGCLPLNQSRVVRAYDSARDFTQLEPLPSKSPAFLSVRAGMFAIFFPHDVHMPGLSVDESPSDVKKIVVKVRV